MKCPAFNNGFQHDVHYWKYTIHARFFGFCFKGIATNLQLVKKTG